MASKSAFNLISDPYERNARLYPALILLAPIIATVSTLFGVSLTTLQAAAGVAVTYGGCFLLGQLARDAGKNREPKLLNKWGGLPSIAIFRHSNARLDPVTKQRYHKKMAALVKGAKAPTPESEASDRAAADQVYAAWSTYLRVNTRDTKKYALLFNENVSYGFRRNLWGLRPFGIALTLLCIGLVIPSVWKGYRAQGHLPEAQAGALFFSLALLVLWVFRFTSNWVRIPSDAYAERLVEAIDMLSSGSTTAKRKAGKTS